MYVQVYLFIILYSYWIATNIIQYLVYLVMLVSEYLSVFAISEKMGSAVISKNYATFTYIGMVGRFCSDDPRFCDCRSDLVPIV